LSASWVGRSKAAPCRPCCLSSTTCPYTQQDGEKSGWGIRYSREHCGEERKTQAETTHGDDCHHVHHVEAQHERCAYAFVLMILGSRDGGWCARVVDPECLINVLSVAELACTGLVRHRAPPLHLMACILCELPHASCISPTPSFPANASAVQYGSPLPPSSTLQKP
jgi:hypothetical protein